MKIHPLKRCGECTQLNKNKIVTFRFDGKRYQGFEGDTLASALLANGIKRVGRSFKFHRPRGLLATGIEECNALVQVDSAKQTEPNVRATMLPISESLRARGQNALPSVNFDVLGCLDLISRLLPASFYYKTMMWPNWSFYERFIRPLAGLGFSPKTPDTDKYVKRNAHCDILIIGAGPAGLTALITASKSDKNIIIIDDNSHLNVDSILEKAGAEKFASLINQSNVRVLTNTRAFGYYENNFVVASQQLQKPNSIAQRLWRIRADNVILATGAIERPLLFPNNDRPGVMLCASVLNYLVRFGVKCGERVVVVTNNDSGCLNAIKMKSLGLNVTAIVDSRAKISKDIAERIERKSIALYKKSVIQDVLGKREVKSVYIAEHYETGFAGRFRNEVKCDLVAMAGGWTPTVHLFSQAGGSLYYDEENSCFVPNKCSQRVSVVGAANGTFRLLDAIEEGRAAGESLSTNAKLNLQSPKTRTNQYSIENYWYLRNLPTEKQWVDFQYDVRVSDIELAERENYQSVEHLKRYTTNGMSIDQGKTSNINALAVMSELIGKPIKEVGTTKYRPPYHPVTLGAIVGQEIGQHYAPVARMPAHNWHVANGGHMQDYGWLRPEYYSQHCESAEQAIVREVLATRNSVGLFDGSPIGKIEINGPDAARFLSHFYVNNVHSLKTGKARYGLMTNENGVVIDDGVFVRMSDDHFLVHTTSSGVGRIYQSMEEWHQCEWPDYKVIINNVTTQWATLTICGPNARRVLEKLSSDIDFTKENFVHMTFKTGHIEGIFGRVLRASYSGEVSYEISVPARYGLSLWERLLEAGQEFSITPFGVESLMVMRCEKGFLHVGADTDGTTNPLDLGWGGPIGKKNEEFIGKRSLLRVNDINSERLAFVGLEAVNPEQPLPIGGHLIQTSSPRFPLASQGYCTSACQSPTLGRSIGLGLIKFGMKRLHEEIYVYSEGKTVKARIVKPTHFDPSGERLKG